jgi:class I fructose-bisphosphate aldolase
MLGPGREQIERKLVTGKELRLKRFLSRADKLVVAALDHGAFHGPLAGLEDVHAACAKLAEADGVLMVAGVFPHVAGLFTQARGPQLITRLNWNSTYCFQWNHVESHHRRMLTVAQAVEAGADIVLASLAIHTGSERTDAENVGLFCDFVREARELGIPLIGEYFPARAETMSQEELHTNIKIGCRVIAELGADLIKTFYTGPRFGEIVAATPVPILVLGAEKTPTEAEALSLAARAAETGARGIVFGRNIVQSRNPAGFIRAVRSVMNAGVSIEAALKASGLGA